MVLPHSLEVEYDGECEWDDERDDGGHDHEVDGRARRVHLVPRDVAPRSLRQRLTGELVRQVVHLKQKREEEMYSGASRVSILKWRGILDDKMEVKWSFSTQI